MPVPASPMSHRLSAHPIQVQDDEIVVGGRRDGRFVQVEIVEGLLDGEAGCFHPVAGVGFVPGGDLLRRRRNSGGFGAGIASSFHGA